MKTLKIDLSPFMAQMGQTESDQIAWLRQHAKMTWPTARSWVRGIPTKVELPILASICEALGASVDQIIVEV